jgi:hypothetical protein
MNIEKELLKRMRDVLRGLEEANYDLYWDIQAELDKPEQEPVAWMTTFKNGGLTDDPYYANHKDYAPLYTSPKREPSMTGREMYQRGYAAGFRDAEKAHGIGVVE